MHLSLHSILHSIMPQLIDISALAACFKEYGPHPLHYVFRLLQPVTPSAYNLLGNTVNNMFDAVVSSANHAADSAPTSAPVGEVSPSPISSFPIPDFSLPSILQRSWHDDALLYLDVDDDQLRKVYFNSVQQQFDNVQQVVTTDFPRQHIDASQAWLEPSFVCPELGLSGRMDLLDLQSGQASIVELKSGKRNEWQGHSKLAHRVQTLLYAEVLHRCLHIPHEQIRSYLHYNTYPLLEAQPFADDLLQQALTVRDQIRDILHQIASGNGRHFFTREAVEAMYSTPGRLWQQYDKPKLLALIAPIEAAAPDVRDWFFTRLAFILREEELQAQQPEALSLRSLPLISLQTNEQDEITDFVLALKFKEFKGFEEFESTPTTQPLQAPQTLQAPPLPEHDFRLGDPVILYPMPSADTQRHDGIILRGSIADISEAEITIRLRHPERPCHFSEFEKYDGFESSKVPSSHTFQTLQTLQTPPYPPFALEHDTINSSVSQVCRSLYSTLIQGGPSLPHTRLIVGPPGTGKTSVTLRNIVQKLYTGTSQRVLLLAFTHRAVDEICTTLDAVCSYVRLGTMTDTPEAFRPHLLQQIIDQCSQRTELHQRLDAERFYVGTTARLMAMPHLFDLLQFDTIIVDEASQLLDHQVIGLLKHARQECILIGDPKQLPAVTLQTGVQSLFEQLYRKIEEPNSSKGSTPQTPYSPYITLLSHQGRMHPAIARFANEMFYGGQLQPVGLPHQLEEQAFMPRYAFIDVLSTPSSATGTKANPAEAQKVARLIARIADIYQQQGLEWTDHTLGIIVPYRQQIAAIKKELAAISPSNEQLSIIDYESSINIDTVERYQGSQRDIIIFTTTVSTPDQLELLSAPITLDGQLIDRKLNVALTRARKHLFIVGNSKLLQQSSIYATLLKMMEE